MIRILIADDEMLVRAGLKSLIDWNGNGFEIVGLAEDGERALRLVEQHLPDVLITDIVMPKLSGMELIRQVRERFPAIHILVLSCHSDYEYVREALKMGADDYILKASMRPDHLLSMVREIEKKILSEQKTLPGGAPPPLVHETMGMLLNGEPVPDDRLKCLYCLGGRMAVVCVKIHHSLVPGLNPMTAIHSLMNLLDEHWSAKERGNARIHRENEIIMFLRADASQELMEQLNASMEQCARVLGIRLSMGVSEPFERVRACKPYLGQARSALEGSFYSEEGGIFPYQADAPRDDAEFLLREHRAYSAVLEGGLPGELTKYLSRLSERVEARRLPVNSARRLYIDLYALLLAAAKNRAIEIEGEERREIPHWRIEGFDFFHQLRAHMDGVAQRYDALLGARNQGAHRREILALLHYMKENYRDDLTLRWASRHVHMSEGHLSRVFKQETGEGFIEYLTRLRVEEAKALLRDTTLLSYEIAERVGYPNANYFGRIFKKVTGRNPNAYRAERDNLEKREDT